MTNFCLLLTVIFTANTQKLEFQYSLNGSHRRAVSVNCTNKFFCSFIEEAINNSKLLLLLLSIGCKKTILLSLVSFCCPLLACVVIFCRLS